MQTVVTLDLEGVLVPEIWVAVAERTGIDELRRTTRDEPDYDVLMRSRLELLDRHGLTVSAVQDVIAGLTPGRSAGFLFRAPANVRRSSRSSPQSTATRSCSVTSPPHCDVVCGCVW